MTTKVMAAIAASINPFAIKVTNTKIASTIRIMMSPLSKKKVSR